MIARPTCSATASGKALPLPRPWLPRAASSSDAQPNASRRTRAGHARSDSEATIVNDLAVDAACESTEPASSWVPHTLLPRLVSPLVSLVVVVVIFPITFFEGTTIPAALKILVSIGLASQLCYACLHVPTTSAAAGRQAYQRLHDDSLSSSTPARALALAATYVLRTLLPLISWLTLYSLLKRMPPKLMAPVDTTTLPRADTWLVGQPAYVYFAPKHDADAVVVVDVVAWFTYGVWHFVSPVACCFVLGVVGVQKMRRDQAASAKKSALTSDASGEDVVVVWENDQSAPGEQALGRRPMSDENIMELGLAMTTSPDATDVELDADSDSDDTLSEIVVSDPGTTTSRTTRLALRSYRSIPTPASLPDALSPAPSSPATPFALTARLAVARAITPSASTLRTALIPIHTFLTCFGCMNLCGVMIQYVYPTAPPWYNQHYGTHVPDNPLSVRGEPAGLSRIDTLFGAPIYKHVFASSPVVFGAWPSLHAGFATMIALAVAKALVVSTARGKVKAWRAWAWNGAVGLCAIGYVVLVWWATMYLCHHFLVDVMAGSAIAVVMFVGVSWVKTRRVGRGCTWDSAEWLALDAGGGSNRSV